MRAFCDVRASAMQSRGRLSLCVTSTAQMERRKGEEEKWEYVAIGGESGEEGRRRKYVNTSPDRSFLHFGVQRACRPHALRPPAAPPFPSLPFPPSLPPLLTPPPAEEGRDERRSEIAPLAAASPLFSSGMLARSLARSPAGLAARSQPLPLPSSYPVTLPSPPRLPPSPPPLSPPPRSTLRSQTERA